MSDGNVVSVIPLHDYGFGPRDLPAISCYNASRVSCRAANQRGLPQVRVLGAKRGAARI